MRGFGRDEFEKDGLDVFQVDLLGIGEDAGRQGRLHVQVAAASAGITAAVHGCDGGWFGGGPSDRAIALT